jgi:lysophospholipase L1-like esterase
MTGQSVAFRGSQTVYGSFSFPKQGGRLRIILDGQTKGFVEQAGSCSMNQFVLADNLDSHESHTLEVYKVTEDGVMTFGGFQLADGGFETTPASPKRRMEFIGDSDTAGWCADGSSKTGDKETKFEDAYVTWAQQLARSFRAEPMVEAVSGWGVTSSSTPIQTVLDYTVRSSKTKKWDYSKWIPDAVVILIGPNDESWKQPMLQGKSFIKQYKALLDMVASNYKGASSPPKVIHVCGGSGNGFDPCDDIQTANKQFNEEQKASGSGMKGFYTTIDKANWNMINGPNGKGTSQYNGCDSHYSEKGHKVLAGVILPQVQKIMGWDSSSDLLIV